MTRSPTRWSLRGVAAAGVGLKLLGGLGVRVVCPDYPPRLRRGQDIDFACLAKERKKVVAYLESAGCAGDRMFNSLNGDRQMYFTAPLARPMDVMVDKLTMCHTLDFRPRSGGCRIPWTRSTSCCPSCRSWNSTRRRARHHAAAVCVPITDDPAQAGPGIDAERFGKVLGADWGWWRTVTGNLDRVPVLLTEHERLRQADTKFDPVEQAMRLRKIADETPKSMKWRMRAGVGDKVRWYELPEEVAH